MGTLRERTPGTWELIVSAGRDPATGRYHRVIRTIHTTSRRQVKLALAELETAVAAGRVSTKDRTLAELLDSWLDHITDLGRADTTLHNYRLVVERDIKPPLGKTKLSKLTALDIDRVYARLRKRGLAPATIRQVHAILRASLHQGERWGLVDRNVARLASPPSQPQREQHPPQPDEVIALLDAHGRIIAGRLDEHLHRLATFWIDHHDRGRSVAVVASTNDHVDVINRAIQTARVDVGQLDLAVTTLVAGGEDVYVGDVIATRRNERRLVSDRGEPVRNRDTWTVTAINIDGALTVTHHGGHGEITLPLDYVRNHVRLGYAATEHGWQSDTVDTAIAPASAVTTRRGLYVAATRGRDENLLSVITDSNDTADARDVLETILHADRADIPATTQRRTLAQTTPHQVSRAAPKLTPRCAIPEWFQPALAAAKRSLDEARTRAAQRLARRERATADVATADAGLADVSAQTYHPRAALYRAEAGVDDARLRRNDLTRRLETAPWRQRRSLRGELQAQQQRLDRAEGHLELTRQRTQPAVEQHTQAAADHRAAHGQLDICHTLDRLDSPQPSVGDHQGHYKALAIWKQWADGHDLPTNTLHTVASLLDHRPGREQQLARVLRNDIGQPEPAPRVTRDYDHYPTRTASHDIGFGR